MCVWHVWLWAVQTFEGLKDLSPNTAPYTASPISQKHRQGDMMGSSLPEEAFPGAQEREEETQSGMLWSFISQRNPHQAARMASSEA